MTVLSPERPAKRRYSIVERVDPDMNDKVDLPTKFEILVGDCPFCSTGDHSLAIIQSKRLSAKQVKYYFYCTVCTEEGTIVLNK